MNSARPESDSFRKLTRHVACLAAALLLGVVMAAALVAGGIALLNGIEPANELSIHPDWAAEIRGWLKASAPLAAFLVAYVYWKLELRMRAGIGVNPAWGTSKLKYAEATLLFMAVLLAVNAGSVAIQNCKL